MRRTSGLTLIEVVVAMGLLAILAVGLLGILPVITKGTKSSSVDTSESQKAISVFEKIAYAWSNPGSGWNNTEVDGQTVGNYVQTEMPGCGASVSTANGDVTRLVVITCDASGNLPQRALRAEFGNPNE